MTTVTAARRFTWKGQEVSISGASTSCLVWINDKAVLGIDVRHKTLLDARLAARRYIDRHVGTGDAVDAAFRKIAT